MPIAIGSLGIPVIQKFITSNVTSIVANSYFTQAEWTGNVPKKLIINNGVYVGSVSPSNPALSTGTGLGRTLEIVNNGAVQAAGGTTSNPQGGTALWNRVGSQLTISGSGSWYGGGGRGGNGGTGGLGLYYTFSTHQDGPAFNNGGSPLFYWGYIPSTPQTVVNWNDTIIENTTSSANKTPFSPDGFYTYSIGTLQQSFGNGTEYWSVKRTYQVQDVPNYTSGGAGGAGGHGQGYQSAAAAGVAGTNPGNPGGSSPGIGGTGGTGGAFGASGSTGATGNGGNAGGGSAGTAGGASGYAILGILGLINKSSGSLIGLTG